MRKQCEAGVLKAIPSLKNSGNIFEKNFFSEGTLLSTE